MNYEKIINKISYGSKYYGIYVHICDNREFLYSLIAIKRTKGQIEITDHCINETDLSNILDRLTDENLPIALIVDGKNVLHKQQNTSEINKVKK